LLTQVGEELDSLKRAVEYIQDMINIQGLKIWYDEYNKLVSVYVDAEWEFIRDEVLPDEALKWASSENKTEAEEILGVEVSNLKKDENGLTFCGRLINAVIKLCHPNNTSYIPKTLSFYKAGGNNVRITMNTFMRIRKCIGANGLHGVNKLLGFMTLSEIYKIESHLNKIFRSDRGNLEKDSRQFGTLNNLFKQVDRMYMSAKKRLKPKLDLILNSLEKIGLYYILK
jgi:WASH complex subunit strumpellin